MLDAASNSVEKNESKLSLLDQLKQQRAQFAAQRELTQTNLNQLIGAVYACDEMIKKHETAELPKGESSDGETDGKKPGEAA